MSVGPIDKGARDASFHQQRKALEQDRANEIESLGKKYKKEIDQTRDYRTEQLEDLHKDTAQEIEAVEKKTDEKVRNVKAGQGERLRTFQEESSKLSQEASRKLQQKAAELNKYSDEFSRQKEDMAKRQNKALEDLGAQQERNYRMQQEKLSKSSENLYGSHKEKIGEIKTKQEQELAYLTEQAKSQKMREEKQGTREIGKLKTDQELAKNSYYAQMAHEKESNAEAMEHFRATQEAVRENTRENFNEQFSNLSLAQKQSLQGQRIKGERDATQLRDYYNHEISSQERENRQKLLSAQAATSSRLKGIENNFEQAEHLQTQGYMVKRKNYEAKMNQTMADYESKNQNLKETLEKDHQIQQNTMLSEKEQTFKNQNEQFAKELNFQREFGEKRVNELAMQQSSRVADVTNKTKDPFYRIHAFDAKVAESENDVVLKINVPEHEKDLVKINADIGKIIVSGSRRFEKKAKSEDGKSYTTHSNQSYSETIPISGVVDMKKLSRTYEGGVLTFRVPKLV